MNTKAEKARRAGVVMALMATLDQKLVDSMFKQASLDTPSWDLYQEQVRMEKDRSELIQELSSLLPD